MTALPEVLWDLLADAARRAPERLAVTRGDGRWTWAELERHARGAAALLEAQGVRAGDRVALLHESSPWGIAAFWGAQCLGAETVDVPSHAAPDTIHAALAECGARAVVLDGAQARRLDRAQLPAIVVGSRASGFDGPAALEDAAPSTRAAARPSREAVALTLYTSGTSGRPKGVMLTHHNLLSNVIAARELSRTPEGASLLLVVPLYFVHGRMQLLSFTLAAGTLHLSQGFMFPERVLDELIATGATHLSGVPYHFTTLMDRTTLGSRPLPQLTDVLITGGALPPAALKRLASKLPGVHLHTAYGMTEASPRVTYLGPSEVLTRPGCAGRPLPGVTVEILGSDGLPVPRGGAGEVAVRGPNVMRGYVSGDEGRIDAQGRLRTGDLGRLDADGALYLVGRHSDLIKSAGERIFPRELEEVLERHPDVLEAAVLGVPDSALGEKLVALVVARPGRALDAAQVKAHALRWLPFVRTPRELHVVAALPKTASGKVDRGALITALGRARQP